MFDLHFFHHLLRTSHVIAGAIGLVLFWIPVLARKGSRLHLASGRLFVWLAYFLSATAAVSCAWALSAPVSFSGITRELTADEVTRLSVNIRFFFAILGTLMCWLVAIVQLGVYTMRTKGTPDATRTRISFFQVAAMACSGALTIAGGLNVLRGGESRSWVHVVLGFIIFSDVYSQSRYLWHQSPPPMAWWLKHMECMLGAGIAFYTAFFVFGFSRIVSIQLEGIWAIVPWVLPSAIGVPATAVWVGMYRRKFAASKSEDGMQVETQQPTEHSRGEASTR